MPQEIEAKFQVTSHEPVRAALQSFGATLHGRVLEWNAIYDRPDGSLRRQGMGLRIRTARSLEHGTEQSTLTFKGPPTTSTFKSRDELETAISDPEQLTRMLKLLGFVPILRYEKRRETWTCGSCHIELDEPPFLGLFIEIEGPDEQTILQIQMKLGLGGAHHTRSSYVRLLLEYCQHHHIGDLTLRLPNSPAG